MTTINARRAKPEAPQQWHAGDPARHGAMSAAQPGRSIKRSETVAGTSGGAAAAAARASAVARRPTSAASHRPQSTSREPSPAKYSPSVSSGLQTPTRPGPVRSPSASNIAAVLAAARFAPQSAARTQGTPQRPPPNGVPRPPSEAELQQEMPPAGAVADVKKWLSSLNDSIDPSEKPLKPPPEPITVISSPREASMLLSPQPVRATTPLKALEPKRDEVATASMPTPITPTKPKPDPPAPRRTKDPTSSANAPLNNIRSTADPSETQTANSTPLSIPAQRPSPVPKAAPHVVKRSATVAQPQSHYHRPERSPHRNNTYMHTADALADAIVASHLASSRASSRPASPSKPTPDPFAPPLPRRQTEKPAHTSFLSHFKHASHSDSRTPSPGKTGLRQTLRDPKPPSSDSDDDAYKPRRGRAAALGIRTHPHKHHEGDRKRWRDRVAEPERRRYEGLWAANRGVAVPFSDAERRAAPADALVPADYAGALAVRELWMRSRLPATVLHEVWELVDGADSGRGRLSREEFVVGLWLVDQRLRGRKLPIRVSEPLWKSVRGAYGIKVPAYK